MADNQSSSSPRLETWAKLAQVGSVVIGIVISIITIGLTLQKEADVRKTEAETRQLELQKYAEQRKDEAEAKKRTAAEPFLKLRQKYYLEAIENAAILSTPLAHSEKQIKEAKKRFGELYWAELALVEAVSVEKTMKALGDSLEPGLTPTPQQRATLDLAHALRDSLLQSWGVDDAIAGQVRR